ncbi:MAG: hypothetical protein HYY13_10530 [Nitrospirae bacterium]|nr:hypothetical protein [Nitrospirota bacterium]
MKRHAILSALSLAGLVWAQGTPARAGEIPRSYRSTRVLAMGGAHAAIADDDATLFMNPAGLHDARSLDIVTLELETNQDTVGTVQDAIDTFGSKGDKTEQSANLFDQAFGRKFGGGLRLSLINVIAGGFGFGFLIDENLRLGVVNPAITQLDLVEVFQAGLALGYAHSFLDRSLRVGVVPKVFARVTGNAGMKINRLLGFVFASEDDREDLSPALTGDSGVPKSAYPDMQGGVAANVDVGGLYNLPASNDTLQSLRPTVALVLRDLPVFDMGASDFADLFGISIEDQAKLKLSSEDTPIIPWSVAVGAAIAPKLGPFRVKSGLDVEDIFFNTTDDTSLLKRFHLGAELQIPPFFKQRKRKEVPFLALQGGVNQVYLGGGISMNIWRLIQIGVATYAEEIGPVAGDRADRRYVFRLAL